MSAHELAEKVAASIFHDANGSGECSGCAAADLLAELARMAADAERYKAALEQVASVRGLKSRDTLIEIARAALTAREAG